MNSRRLMGITQRLRRRTNYSTMHRSCFDPGSVIKKFTPVALRAANARQISGAALQRQQCSADRWDVELGLRSEKEANLAEVILSMQPHVVARGLTAREKPFAVQNFREHTFDTLST